MPEFTAVNMVVSNEACFSALAVTAVTMSIPAARRVVSVTDVTDTLLGATLNTSVIAVI